MEKNRYKLLIADDEYWTREKIRTMIRWEEYEIEFMPPAQDGEEVLQILQKEKADILITDINMPFINGVELVKTVKERYPDMVVFVISGYDDFAYVKETLVAGAINYLLKPVSRIELVHAVSHALEIISEKEENEKQVLKAASLLQDRELSLLVEKEQTVISAAPLAGEEANATGSCVLLVKIHELPELMGKYGYDMNFLSYSLKKRLRQIAGGMEGLLIFNYMNRSNEFVIMAEQEPAQLKALAAKILKGLKEEVSGPVTIAVSERTYSIESIHNAYVQSVSILMTRPYTKESSTLFYNSEKGSIENQVKNRLTQEYEWQLRGLLKSGSQKAVKEFLEDRVGLKTCNNGKWDYLEVKQTMKRISTVLIEVLLEQGGREKAIRELERLEQMEDKVIDRLDAARVCELTEEMLDAIFSDRKSEITGNIRDIVKEAAAYIDENYFKELTLSSLSEKYCVESSYFSRVFKQETGENLMLYITGKRMEKAKEIMSRQEINMAEVAFMVGYDDYTYFSKVFKKMTGMSPREYRSRREAGKEGSR